MQQLQIQFFFPLTEQIPLELDFKPCQDYETKLWEERTKSSITLSAGSGLCLTASSNGTVSWASVDPTYENFSVLQNEAVGDWKVTPNMNVGRKTKPKLLHRIFTKLILGWEWKDK